MPRELLDIDGEEVRRLASYGCTQDEIAEYFGCDQSTISKRFSSEFALGKAEMKISLRRWQIRRARKGSDTMLIHLGKQYLGQAEKVEQKNQSEATILIVPDNGRDEPAEGPAREIPREPS